MRPGAGRTWGATGPRLPLLVLPVVLLLSGCGSDPDERSGPDAAASSPAAASPEAGSPGAGPAGPEEGGAQGDGPGGEVDAVDFVDLLAAHLCTVQGTVYDDPAQMGEAFGSLPEVPGLTAAEAEELAAEVRADPDLSAALNDALQDACGDA